MIEINDQLVALNNDFEIDSPSILSTCGNRIYKCGSFIANVLRFKKRNLRIFYFFLKVYNFFCRVTEFDLVLFFRFFFTGLKLLYWTMFSKGRTLFSWIIKESFNPNI